MNIFMVVLDRAKCAAGCALTPRAATDVIMAEDRRRLRGNERHRDIPAC